MLRTARSPCFCALLELQKNVSSFIIVVEVMDVVENQDKGLSLLLRVAKGDFLKLIES